MIPTTGARVELDEGRLQIVRMQRIGRMMTSWSNPLPRGLVRFGLVLAGVLSLAACDVREYARVRGAKLRLSIATGQVGATYYVYGGAIAKVISDHVPNVEATAEITAATVDNLKLLRAGQVDLALVIGSTLADAHAGTGAFKTIGRVPVRALAMLYLQPMHLVALTPFGRVVDLRGHAVSTSAPGSGSEEIALQMLRAAGLDPDADLQRERLGPSQSVDALQDGKIDAFFISGAPPLGAVLDLASTHAKTMRLVPSDELLPELQRRYGPGRFIAVAIPAHSYPGQDHDVATVGGASLLVVDAAMSEQLAYEITRALFDHQAELAAVHPAARQLSPSLAVTASPVPFHPGAVRFYREKGVWKE